jgi:hypothetical protein
VAARMGRERWFIARPLSCRARWGWPESLAPYRGRGLDTKKPRFLAVF